MERPKGSIPLDHVQPLHYDITLKPTLEKKNLMDHIVEGEVHIHVRVKTAVTSITLNELHTEIKHASYRDQSGSAPHNSTSRTFNEKHETVTFDFEPGVVVPGEGVLSIGFVCAYNGEKNERTAWMYRPYERNGQQLHALFTQYEPCNARQAFPCWDQPAAKATFKLTLIVPNVPDLTVLSNTPLERSAHQAEDNTVTHVFERTPMMSTYLLAFAIGHFDHVAATVSTPVYDAQMQAVAGQTHDCLIRVLTPEGKRSEGEYALKWAVDAYKFYTEGFKFNYPLRKMDLISVPDLPFFGMENWGLLTFKSNVFLVSESTVLSVRQRCARLVCHEVVHQWFGNLVTCEWWKYLWLQEGFARFLEYATLEKLAPEWTFWSDFVRNIFQFMLRLDETPDSTHPIEATVNSPSEIKAVFDAISYGKGASVLRMVVNFVGDKFWPALAVYLRRHQYGSATTPDLWAVFSEVSGVDLQGHMSDWVSKAGHPIVFLDVQDSAEGGDTVTYTIEQRLCSKDERTLRRENYKLGPQGSLYPLFLMIRSGNDPRPERVIVTESKATLVRPRPASWVSLNSGATGLFRVRYGPALETKLRHAIHSHELPIEERLSILLDMDAFLANHWANATHVDLVRLLTAYETQTDSFMVDAMAASLSNLLKSLRATSLFNNLRAFAVRLLAASVAKDGFGLAPPAAPIAAAPLPHHKAAQTCLAAAHHPGLVNAAQAVFDAHKERLAEALALGGTGKGITAEERDFLHMCGTLQLAGVFAWAHKLLLRSDLTHRPDVEIVFVRAAQSEEEVNAASLFRLTSSIPIGDNYRVAMHMLKRAATEKGRDIPQAMVNAVLDSPPDAAEAKRVTDLLHECMIFRTNPVWATVHATHAELAALLAPYTA